MTESKNEIEMNDDLKQLSYYSLESNDHILVRTTWAMIILAVYYSVCVYVLELKNWSILDQIL